MPAPKIVADTARKLLNSLADRAAPTIEKLPEMLNDPASGARVVISRALPNFDKTVHDGLLGAGSTLAAIHLGANKGTLDAAKGAVLPAFKQSLREGRGAAAGGGLGSLIGGTSGALSELGNAMQATAPQEAPAAEPQRLPQDVALMNAVMGRPASLTAGQWLSRVIPHAGSAGEAEQPQTATRKRTFEERFAPMLRKGLLGAAAGGAGGAGIGLGSVGAARALHAGVAAGGNHYLNRARAWDKLIHHGIYPGHTLDQIMTAAEPGSSALTPVEQAQELLRNRDWKGLLKLHNETSAGNEGYGRVSMLESHGDKDFLFKLGPHMRAVGLRTINGGPMVNPEMPGFVTDRLAILRRAKVKRVFGEWARDGLLEIDPKVVERLKNLRLPERAGAVVEGPFQERTHSGVRWDAPELQGMSLLDKSKAWLRGLKHDVDNASVQQPAASSIRRRGMDSDQLKKLIAEISPLERRRIGLTDKQIQDWAEAAAMSNSAPPRIWNPSGAMEVNPYLPSQQRLVHPQFDMRMDDPSTIPIMARAKLPVNENGRFRPISLRKMLADGAPGMDRAGIAENWTSMLPKDVRAKMLARARAGEKVDVAGEIADMAGIRRDELKDLYARSEKPVEARAAVEPVAEPVASLPAEDSMPASTKAVARKSEAEHPLEVIRRALPGADAGELKSMWGNLSQKDLLRVAHAAEKGDQEAAAELASVLGVDVDELPILLSKSAAWRASTSGMLRQLCRVEKSAAADKEMDLLTAALLGDPTGVTAAMHGYTAGGKAQAIRSGLTSAGGGVAGLLLGLLIAKGVGKPMRGYVTGAGSFLGSSGGSVYAANEFNKRQVKNAAALDGVAQGAKEWLNDGNGAMDWRYGLAGGVALDMSLGRLAKGYAQLVMPRLTRAQGPADAALMDKLKDVLRDEHLSLVNSKDSVAAVPQPTIKNVIRAVMGRDMKKMDPGAHYNHEARQIALSDLHSGPGVAAHELGHHFGGTKMLHVNVRGKPLSTFGTLLALMSPNENAAQAAAAAGTAGGIMTLASELDASRRGYKLLRGLGGGRRASLKAFAGIPTYLIAGAAPALAYFGKGSLGGFDKRES